MHEILYKVYPEKVDGSKVQAEWDEYVRKRCYLEGASGLVRDIRWLRHICDSYDDAKAYIEENDIGWYDQLAVRFRRPKTKSKKIKLLEEKQKEAVLKYRQMDSKFHFADAKSAFIGCKKCGSKLNRERLQTNYCPLCRNDLRPTSVLDAIKKAKQKASDLEPKLLKKKRKLLETRKTAKSCGSLRSNIISD